MWNCIVTGGSRGIGRGIVQRLLNSGHRVAMCDIDLESAAKLQTWVDHHHFSDRYMFIHTDVSQEKAVGEFYTAITEAFMPTIHLLVNNAAIASQYYPTSEKKDRFPADFISKLDPTHAATIQSIDLPLLGLQYDTWNRYLQTNLTSIYLMSKYALPFMLPQTGQGNDVSIVASRDDNDDANPSVTTSCHGASIINISSTRALMSEPNTEAYSATKGGVVSLTHSLAMSLGPYAIRVNCILPGWIDTLGDFDTLGAFDKPHHDDNHDDDNNNNGNTTDNTTNTSSSPSLQHIQASTGYQYHPDITGGDHSFHPAQRVGVPDDIAQMVLFLADSSKSGFITGQQFVIDGGMVKKMMYE